VLPADWDKGDLPETDRFVLTRRLGAGGMGVVYEAMDRERNARVALKTLRDLDADGIYYLKREFRALAGVAHPNLVQLHELHQVGERWFFTMELLEGTDLLGHVRDESPPELLPSGVIYQRPNLARLRATLRQLAQGVAALHATGKLHRDIKPSNALVTPQGRVVLLDFGLVTDLTLTRLYQTVEPKLVGTPAYLAPEQAAREPPSPACDWYSVGALLYEALAGVPPFTGNLLEVLMAKQERDPPPPSSLAPSVPADLEALCLELLRRQPERRPGGAEVLRWLGHEEEAPEVRLAPAGAAGAPWVGRGQHMGALGEALEVTVGGRPVVVFAHGASGMGKTALVQRFLDEVSRRPGVVVLPGRCYERELVPYRALDSLVDALARHLMGLPLHEAEALVPRDTQALVRVFPVLRRAEALAAPTRKATAAGAATDPHELRRRAFAALRELFGRIADRKTLVLHIDDLQWGDLDSATLLRHLTAPPDAPAALLVFSYRSEDAAESPCVQALRAADLGGAEAERRELAVGPLEPAEARSLALSLLGEGGPEAALSAAAIAEESGGSPFFIEELVKHLRAGAARGKVGRSEGVTLDEVLRARVVGLGEEPRRLVEALAVAGRPLTRDVANRVAGLPPGEEQPLGVLRAGHLVRTRDNAEALEVAHDRIRLAVLQAMPPARVRENHQRLARTLAAVPDVDPELLALHLEGAGERARAGLEAARAAARADEALAFERAVRLYRWALSLTDGDERERAPVQARLGDALAHLGHGAEAADAYLAAARGSVAAPALELRRRAAEQLLRVGHLDQGLSALRTVLHSIGAELAPTPRQALRSLALRRLRIRVRGLRFEERDPSQIAAQDLTRLDVFWSVSTALGIIDSVRGIDFQSRHLLLALQLGEPYRIARALAAEAVYSASAGSRSQRRTARLVEAAEEVAGRVDQPFARGWATLAAGMAAYFEGRHRAARELCDRAEAVFQGCVGVWWEVGSARLFSLWSLYYLGELGELSRRLPLFLKQAEEHGDRYNATNFRTSACSWFWLAADQPERAVEEADGAMRRWSRESYHSQHFWHMVATTNAHLYRGDAQAARTRVDHDWGPLSRALLLRVQIARIEGYDLRGRTALALAAVSGGIPRAELLASAQRNASRLRREGTPVALALAHLLGAGAAAVEGHVDSARRALERALPALQTADLALHAASARRRLGELLGGDEGARLCAEADAWMAGQGIRNPARVAATLAPGFATLKGTLRGSLYPPR
jgi:hypothetical protein